MAEFDFKELVSKAFIDYVGPYYPTFALKNGLKEPVLPGLSTVSAILEKNQPYFMTLSLGYKGKVYSFPNEPLISLSIKKTIVETATVGQDRKGTVKEYINTDDWNITIRGICIDIDKKIYPTDQVNEINAMYAVNDALDVMENKFFEIFDIRKIVLKDLKYEEMVGQPSIQKYTITAVSDEDFLAEIKS